MREFRLPDVGEGISEGQLMEWLVAVGDVIDEGQVVAEVATDKVTVELPSPAAGTVTSLAVDEGAVVPVGDVILVLDGEDTPAPDAAPSRAAGDAQANGAGEAPPPPPTSRTTGGDHADPLATRLGRVVAAPSTRRFAADHDVDLTTLRGNGPGGRILRADVETAMRPAPTAPSPVTSGGSRRESLRGVRHASFSHMERSARTTAASTTTFEAHGDGILRLVADLKPQAEIRGTRVTPVTVVAACVATVLRQHPRFNATLDDEARELVLHDLVDMGIAVATDGGLVVPVLRDVANRRVLDLASDLSAMAAKARDGSLVAADLQGGTFTLSSTGSIETATIVSTEPVINVPQVATMWVSRILDRPRVRDGALEAGPVLTVSIAFDHRVVDGAETTQFINDLSVVLEAPARGLA